MPIWGTSKRVSAAATESVATAVTEAVESEEKFEPAPAGGPPPKRRSSTKLTELRKQLRAKLLTAPHEADDWKRDDPDHQKTVSDRLNEYVSTSGLSLDNEELDTLRQG